MRIGLRWRLLLPVGVLLLLNLAVTAWAATRAASEAETRLNDSLRTIARTLSEPPTFPLTPLVLEKMKALSGAEFILIESNGNRLSTRGPLPADFLLRPELNWQGQDYRFLEFPLPENHPNAGGTLGIGVAELRRKSAVREAILPPLLLGAALALATLALAFLADRIARRVGELQRHTRTLADGNYSPAALPPQDDELRDLAVSLNDLAQQLAGFERKLKETERLRILGQFSGGLAHQLRNAASGAKLAVQLQIRDADPENLDVALRQLERMETLLRQFLSLGKPDSAQRESLDLADLISQSVSLIQPTARHAGIQLDWRASERFPFLGDSISLGHLFGNLLGNALDAAGPGGRVEVRLISNSHSISVEVWDSGPGPSAAVAETLFEPFVTGKDQGIGLGLAVAKQVAEAHGGTLNWERADGRTVFRATFPLEAWAFDPG